MISKFQVGLNCDFVTFLGQVKFFIVTIPDLCRLSYFQSLLRQGRSEPEFYGDLVYRLKKIVGSYNFSARIFCLNHRALLLKTLQVNRSHDVEDVI